MVCVLVRVLFRAPENQTVVNGLVQVVTRQRIPTFLTSASRQGNQFTEVAIAIQVLRQQYQLHAIFQCELAADQQLESQVLCFGMRTHHACDRAFVGNSECCIA